MGFPRCRNEHWSSPILRNEEGKYNIRRSSCKAARKEKQKEHITSSWGGYLWIRIIVVDK